MAQTSSRPSAASRDRGTLPTGTPPRGALSGLLAAALALAVAQAFAGWIGTTSSPVLAVGGVAIDAAPEAVKSFAIRTFGTGDKLALVAGMAIVIAICAALVGVLAARRTGFGWAGMGAFGILGLGAVLTRPGATPIDLVPTATGVAAGLVALTLLVRAARRGAAAPAAMAATSGVAPAVALLDGDAPASRARRRFLVTALGVAATSAVMGSISAVELLLRAPRFVAGLVPVASDVGPATPLASTAGVAGVPPFITPAADFYRVDTAIVPPVVDAAAWRLRVHGLVDREIELDLPTLVARPSIERDITLTCVSNEVGGPYAGNARWIGIPLKPLLDEAGVQPGADQLISRSVDGFTAGTPTAIAMDGRDAMLAVAMNGQPLPVEHGYPVRLIVPGLFGYVSATKWLVDLELTTFAAEDGYWVKRGWSPRGPVKTMARIDAPAGLSVLPAGPVAIGGVAWAQHRGIAGVEVRIDDGPWVAARLAAIDTLDTWRQWSHRWDATSGRHTITARATDGTGAVQPETRAEPFPDGATGWHSLVVTVS